MNLNDVIKNISDQTIGDVLKEEIVLPSFYAEQFMQNAQKLGVSIEMEDLNKMIDKVINQRIDQAENMIRQTNGHLDELGKQASKAQDAIKTKDDKILDEINYNISSIKNEVLKLKKQLYTDTLTNVKNRKWINEECVDNNNQFLENGNMVFIDLNSFKNINDTYGHVVGDKVLIFIATFLDRSLDKNIYAVTRYAGDEFIVFSKDIPLVECARKFKQLQDDVANKTLKTQDDEHISITFSYGIESFKKGDDFKHIISLADKKMYNNKQTYKEKHEV